MRAIVQDTYGDADVLQIRDIAEPVPGKGEVTVDVRAAGVDRGVWHLMKGEPLLVRLAFGLRGPKQSTPGLDVSGVVRAVGEGVTGLAVGDEVMGIGMGTFAEVARAQARKLVAKPAELSFVEAAAMPISASTAIQAIDKADVSPGQRVLITGAGGGVGHYAVQVAADRGAEIVASCSAGKADAVRSLGAGEVVDYRSAEPSGRFDRIVDIAGNRGVRRLRSLLTEGGTAVLVGAEDNGRILGPVGRMMAAGLYGAFVSESFRSMYASESQDALLAVVAEVERGLRPRVEHVYALADAPKALRRLTDQPPLGKLVLEI